MRRDDLAVGAVRWWAAVPPADVLLAEVVRLVRTKYAAPNRTHPEVDQVRDRVLIAVRVFQLLGRPIDPDVVVRAAGLECHSHPDFVLRVVAIVAADLEHLQPGRLPR